MVKRVVILGPESTGKSTLCQMLATYFNTIWCPEYAREYLFKHGKDYTFEDLLSIAKGQLALEEEYVQMVGSPEEGKSESKEDGKMESPEFGKSDSQWVGKTEDRKLNIPHSSNFFQHESASGLSDFLTKKLLFIDTDQYVMKVWCEYVFGDCHNWILRRIAEQNCDLYLLCAPDLPWVQDELREYPDEQPRKDLYKMYKDIMMNQSVPWVEINGSYSQRFELAKSTIKKHLDFYDLNK